MNKQGTKANPSGGIEWCHIFGPGTGFTANPVRGCRHDCRWLMPDGKVVGCYAKAQKERRHGTGSFAKIEWHPEVLAEIKARQQPAGIFIDSMSDLFGSGVYEEWIMEVIETCRACPQHIFFTLTKNPGRLGSFSFPPNMLVGLSAPPTFMFGKELSPTQRFTWFRKGLEMLSLCRAKNLWVSLEPLSLDISEFLSEQTHRLCWAVIGAGSDGAKYYQPDKAALAKTLDVLDANLVFMKGNLDRKLVESTGWAWRREFPAPELFKLPPPQKAFLPGLG